MEKIIRKSLLYKSKMEYADYSINHVEGCSHGCSYCYAMLAKIRRKDIKDYKEWTKPKIIGNALELLEKEIPKYKKDIKSVFLSLTTDPFMYQQDEIRDLSLKIIERLNKDNIKSIVLTKGILPKQLAQKEIYGANNEYGITVDSLSRDYAKQYKPGAAPISESIKSLKFLHDAKEKTFASIEPYPTPNIFPQNIDEILKAISFVDKIIFGRLNYNPRVKEFKEYQAFYNEMAAKVKSFCKKNNIECIIKKRTVK